MAKHYIFMSNNQASDRRIFIFLHLGFKELFLLSTPKTCCLVVVPFAPSAACSPLEALQRMRLKMEITTEALDSLCYHGTAINKIASVPRFAGLRRYRVLGTI